MTFSLSFGKNRRCHLNALGTLFHRMRSPFALRPSLSTATTGGERRRGKANGGEREWMRKLLGWKFSSKRFPPYVSHWSRIFFFPFKNLILQFSPFHIDPICFCRRRPKVDDKERRRTEVAGSARRRRLLGKEVFLPIKLFSSTFPYDLSVI